MFVVPLKNRKENMKLIGLNGSMGVGKSTAIELTKELSAQKVKLVKFAQPLYDMQGAIYKRIASVYERPETFIKDRKLLQWLGTEWGRDTISKTLWVDIWKAEAIKQHNLGSSETVIVCDDVRFDNEAAMIKSLGGVIIRITSNKANNRIDTAAGLVHHASESGIDDKFLDGHIVNDGSLSDFKLALLELYNKLGVL